MRRGRALCYIWITPSRTWNLRIPTWFFSGCLERDVCHVRSPHLCVVCTCAFIDGEMAAAPRLFCCCSFFGWADNTIIIWALFGRPTLRFCILPDQVPPSFVRPFKRHSPEVVAPRNRVFYIHNHTVCMRVCLDFKRWNLICNARATVNGFCSIFKNCRFCMKEIEF